METFKLLYIAMGPGIALAVYIYYSDRWEPEPKSLVIKTFLLGGLACFPTGYYERSFQTVFGLEGILEGGLDFYWWQTAFYSFFGVALAEELCKFLFLKAFAYDDREFSEPVDGIVYGGIVGCGFATVENLFYVFQTSYEVGILRMFTAVPTHAFTGIIMGYFMGKAKFSRSPEKYLMQGLILGVLLHGIYDTAAFSRLSWSIYLIYAIVFLGIYPALKAKKNLEKFSEFVEYSSKEFFLLKEGEKQGPLLLKEIRNSLAEGRLELDEVLIDRENGKQQLVREVLYSGIGAEFKDQPHIPPQGQPVKHFMIIYGLTFGLYLYFWLLRNYREFKNYKKLDLNPELRSLGMLVFALIPYYIYGAVLEAAGKNPFDPFMEIPFKLLVAGIEMGFLFFLLRLLKQFLAERLEGSFALLKVSLVFLILSSARKILPLDISFYWFWELVLILFQGGVLALVQRDLNRYWKFERDELIGMA